MEAPKNCPAVKGQLGLVDGVVHKDEPDGDPREKTSKMIPVTATRAERAVVVASAAKRRQLTWI
jgi:hypothetical protein